MMLRPEGEAASDFQDYTLVAVIAVAAHLCGTHVGDPHFIAALAQRCGQDSAALQQVSLCTLATQVCAALGLAQSLCMLHSRFWVPTAVVAITVVVCCDSQHIVALRLDAMLQTCGMCTSHVSCSYGLLSMYMALADINTVVIWAAHGDDRCLSTY